MRWDNLFADLAGQLESRLGAEQAELVAELTRAERAGVALADRLRAHRGPVRLTLADGQQLAGELTECGADWLLLAGAPYEHLVPHSAVALATGLTDRVAPAQGPATARLGLTTALRAVARDRRLVRVVAAGVEASGLVAAVGADHLDLAPVGNDGARPTGDRLTVPLRALVRLSHG